MIATKTPTKSAADEMIDKGISIYYLSEEHECMVEEDPDGVIRLVESVEGGRVTYQDEICPACG